MVADLQQIPEDNGPLETDVQLDKDDPTQNQIPDDPSGVGVFKLTREMGAMATQLEASERMIQDLRSVVVQQAKQQKLAIEELRSVVMEQKSTIEEQRGALAQQRSIMSAMGSTVEQLNMEVRNRPKVAFSASLYSSGSNNIGPYPGDTNLVFRNIITNVGNAYSPATGIFEAPVEGVYYFRFTVFGLGSKSRRVSLFKNGQQIVIITDSPSSGDGEDGSANAAVLKLQQGDEVHLVLHGKFHHVYDDQYRHTTFSGFLLFT